jgi:ribosomal protein S17
MTSLRFSDLQFTDKDLFITFSLLKKHKLGMAQFLKHLEKTNPSALSKPYTELQTDWKAWKNTSAGTRVKHDRRKKTVSLEDKYAQMILEYTRYMHDNHPTCTYVFPSGKCFFGDTYLLDETRGLSGSQLLKILKVLAPTCWLHLWRELVAKEVIEADNSIDAINKVKTVLDLQEASTAWLYADRFLIQRAKTER